jgi:hypothetical protein
LRSALVNSKRYGLDFPVTEDLINRFLGDFELPAEGMEIAEIARQNGAPEHLVRALRQITPAKIFHNTFEVWFDAVHALQPRAA